MAEGGFRMHHYSVLLHTVVDLIQEKRLFKPYAVQYVIYPYNTEMSQVTQS